MNNKSKGMEAYIPQSLTVQLAPEKMDLVGKKWSFPNWLSVTFFEGVNSLLNFQGVVFLFFILERFNFANAMLVFMKYFVLDGSLQSKVVRWIFFGGDFLY